MSSLKNSALATLIVGIVTLILFVFLEQLSFGFEPGAANNTKIIQIFIITGGCFLGIFSKQVFERIQASKNKIFLLTRDTIAACIIAPIVIYPIYSNLNSITDTFILFLVSYQNGFFFAATLNYVMSNSSDKT